MKKSVRSTKIRRALPTLLTVVIPGILFGNILHNNILESYDLMTTLTENGIEEIQFLGTFRIILYPIGIAIFGYALSNFITFKDTKENRFSLLHLAFVLSVSCSLQFFRFFQIQKYMVLFLCEVCSR